MTKPQETKETTAVVPAQEEHVTEQFAVPIEGDTLQSFLVEERRPPLVQIIKQAEEELDLVPEMAEKVYYVLPFRQKQDDGTWKVVHVEGIGIKGAMNLLRHWGNCTDAGRMVLSDEKQVAVQGLMIDYETNRRTARGWIVPRFRYNKSLKSMERIRDDLFVSLIKAEISKATRNAILAAIPLPLQIRYLRKAKTIIGQGVTPTGTKQEMPLAQRVKVMFEKMEEIGATKDRVIQFLKVKSDAEITLEMIIKMVGVYNTIMEGEATFADYFAEEGPPKQTIGEQQLDGILGAQQPPPESAPLAQAVNAIVEQTKPPDAPASVEPPPAAVDEERYRAIALQETVEILKEVYPKVGETHIVQGRRVSSLSAADKKGVTKLIKDAFGVEGYVALTQMPVPEISKGLDKLRKIVDERKANVAQ